MHVILWTYTVRPGCSTEFERHYGPHGTWTRFFRRSPAFVRTELMRDPERPREYATIDYWESREAFTEFEAANGEDYRRIDEGFETLTEKEERIGGFELV